MIDAPDRTIARANNWAKLAGSTVYPARVNATTSGTQSTAAIETHGLIRRFGDVAAVAGVDLRVEEGEIYGFLGPNGAGKSTTVRMLCTLLGVSEGTAIVAGHDVATSPDEVRLRIGVALQEAALDPKQTGRELLDLSCRLFGLDRATRLRRVDDLIALVNIGDAIDRRVKTYSGGMARRLDLACALVHQPLVLFLDEPTTGLDPVSRTSVWEEVRRLNREEGTTIFLTTQYLEEADQLADRVGIINRGTLAAEGTPDALKRSLGTDTVEVTLTDQSQDPTDVLRALTIAGTVRKSGATVSVDVNDGASSLSPIAVALANAGIGVQGLTVHRPTLDDVFLHVTGERLQNEEKP
jgi:ABC-2 type transport system ATP-binding protein